MDLRKLRDTPPWDWPEDAGNTLHEILADDQSEASEHILAAELAGDYTVINDELADDLLSILQDGNESAALRGRAAISLGPALDHADTDGFHDPDDVPISEDMFHNIQDSLRRLYLDADVPKTVGRRILEASVRAPQDWHRDAIRTAYSRDDEDLRLTAVFAMRWVRGFDNQILEALESKNPDIHYQAVCAAGNWEVDAAWSHVARILRAQVPAKSLLLAAIDSAASIRPHEAGLVLLDLTDSDDEDIAEAAHEAMAMAEAISQDLFDDNDDDGSVR